MTRRVFVSLIAGVSLLLASVPAGAAAAAEGRLTYAVHVTLASRWLDPTDTEGIVTPFMVFYTLHDALLKPMPGQPMAPSLAESWTESKDGLTVEFALRKGLVFHNGDPFTAEDVRFSFQRYRGASAKLLKDSVQEVEVVDPHPQGFDGGEFFVGPPYFSLGESILGYLQAIGIRVKLRTMERAAFFSAWRDKRLKNLSFGATGAAGNAATRIESFVVTGGPFAYGGYPDLDDLARSAARELDRTKRGAMLQQIQRLMHERVMFGPIWQYTFLNGTGPGVADARFTAIAGFPYTAPYEEIRLSR